ncbi:hypothetical protein CCR75_009459 [Bremia lactucae]|uniref:Cyclin N-terminal domain-containing protein n=1 Tax=Bremia lactucae TaxID=4779 RepID=A0A976FGT1_BRELC|nr:hypothetical protein CCR75_009459 [Bremia lactucae]
MVFTEITALVHSRWQKLRGALDTKGHERRVQQRLEKKRAKQQRKAARRALREARRGQRKQRHALSPTMIGEHTDDEPESSTSRTSSLSSGDKQLKGTLKISGETRARSTENDEAKNCISVAMKDIYERRWDLLKPSSPEYVCMGSGSGQIVEEVLANTAMPQLSTKVEPKIEAQLKQGEIYDSLGGYSTVDDEEDELLTRNRRTSTSTVPFDWKAEMEESIEITEASEPTESSYFIKEELLETSTAASKETNSALFLSSSVLVETNSRSENEADDGSSMLEEEDCLTVVVDNSFSGHGSLPRSTAAEEHASDEVAAEAKIINVTISFKEAQLNVEVESREAIVEYIDSATGHKLLSESLIVPAENEAREASCTCLDIPFGDKIKLLDQSTPKKLADAETKGPKVFTMDEKVAKVKTEELSEVVKKGETVAIKFFELGVDECMIRHTVGSPSQSFDMCTKESGVCSPGTTDEYASSIYENLRAREHRYHVTEDIFAKQQGVHSKMRALLVDWLVEVHQRFELEAQTLFLAVNYLDRYVAQVPVKSQRYQLVGVAALLIASKFEEIYPCDMEDLLYICERSYVKADLVDCEMNLLNKLDFNLAVPSVSTFLCFYLEHFDEDKERISQLASYFAECSLLDFIYGSTYEPSVIACACLVAAYCYVENQTPCRIWNTRFVELTGYQVSTILPCTRDLLTVLIQPSELAAVTTKYSAKEYGEVAQLPLRDLKALLH